MTMGEKIVALRKGQGWSQDDLAERLDVSRQSVSKWEGGLAAPEIEKLLRLSEIFSVSCDYLIKDDMTLPDAPEAADAALAPGPVLRQVGLEEAREFLTLKRAAAKPTALAVALCILSPICLILLGGAATNGVLSFPEQWAAMAGVVILLLFVIPAVGIFLRCGIKTEKYEFLEKEVFTAGPGVTALAREGMDRDRETHSRRMVTGVCLCVAAAVPMLVCMAVDDEFLLSCGIGLLLAIVAAGVYTIVETNTVWGSYQMLLQEGDYAPEQKSALVRNVSVAYWCVATAGYLLWSFLTDDWDRTWLVWPVAGVLFAALITILTAFVKRKKA